jgi:exosortase
MGFSQHKRFLVWLVLAIAAWWPALRALVRAAIGDENYSYTLLVLGVSVVLLALDRWDSVGAAGLRPDGQPGAAVPTWVLLGVLCLALLGAAWFNFRVPFRGGDSSLAISIFLWISFLLAAFVYTCGWETFSRQRFPWMFSLLAVPPPDRVIDTLTIALQWSSADAAYLLFRLFHIPVVRDGLVFSFSRIDIEVARECSSIRSSTILFVTTLVLAQLFLKSTRGKWIVVLLSLPVAVVKNGVRIFTLSLLAEYVSTSWLDGWFHHQGGFIFLALGLGIMLTLIWLMGRAEARAR